MHLGRRTTALLALVMGGQLTVIVVAVWKASDLAKRGVFVPGELWMVVMACVLGLIIVGVLVAVLGNG